MVASGRLELWACGAWFHFTPRDGVRTSLEQSSSSRSSMKASARRRAPFTARAVCYDLAMNSRFIYGWLVGLCLLLGACRHEKERTIRASDYEQTCSKDSDCKTVLVGDPCKCSCEA